ncbi:MAG: DEAD/DEAH box helicase, partial [Nanoarchaeota archaeon]|nr:DEAD/DEAH box helicase [Nanoarchaeota archaeon]
VTVSLNFLELKVGNGVHMGEILFKSNEQLKRQVDAVDATIEERFIRSSDDENIFEKTVDELREHYPARYALYRESLRKKSSLSDDEKRSIKKTLGTLNNLDRYIEGMYEEDKEYTLRAHQQTVFEDLRDFLENGNREGYIKLPTGAGKTVVFIDFLKATDLKSLIVVPSTILINQTERQIQKFAKGIDVGKYYGQKKDLGRQVTVITYDSFVAGVKSGVINPDEYDAVILDEVHRSLSESRMEAVGKFPHSIKIGFTATDVFSLDKRVANLLPNEIHRMDIREAAEQGILSPLRCYLAQTEIDLSSIKVTGGDFNEKQLEKAINVQSRNKAAVQLYKKGFAGRHAVAYCVGVKHASDLADLFMSEGVSATVISGKTNDKEKEKILDKYHTGEIKILCNADILIEGFDEPKASVCLNLRPTLSMVVAEQRGGRVLRLNEDDPEKEAFIIDFIDKNEDKERASIVFPDIVGAAVIPQASKDSSGGGQRRGVEEEFPHIEGLRMITNASEVMRLTGERGYKERPEGYLSSEELAVELGVPFRKIHSEAKNLFRVEQRGGWGGMSITYVYNIEKFRGLGGKVREHFTHKQVDALRDVFRPAPEGYFTLDELAPRFGLMPSQLKSDMHEFLPLGISEYVTYYYKGGEKVAHYELREIEAIREKIEWKQKPVTLGLISRRDVQEAVSYDVLERSFQKKCNEVIEKLQGERMYTGVYYQKNSVEKIREILNTYRFPKGWIVDKDIISTNLLDKDAVLAVLGEVVNKNPELKHVYLNIDDDSELVRYDPSIESLIIHHLALKSLPVGWATESEIEKRFGIVDGSLREIVMELMKKRNWRFGANDMHVAWLAQGNTHVLCMDVEVAFILENEAYKKGVGKRESENVESIPDDWMKFEDALVAIGVMTKGALVGAMEQERNKLLERVAELINRDYFGGTQIQRKKEASGVVFPYYSPELIEVVKQNRFTIRQSPPRSMVLIEDACKDLHMSQEEFLTHVRNIRNLNFLGYYQKKKGVVDVYYSKDLLKQIVDSKK